jgi:hypothetical protein
MKTMEHVADEDLVLLAVGELDPAKTARVGAHLEACGRCQDALNEIRRTLQGYDWARSAELDAHIPPIAPSRAALAGRLAAVRAQSNTWLGLQPRRAHWALALAALLTLAGLWSIGANRRPAPADRFAPDPRLTPGMTAAVSRSELCAAIPGGLPASVDRALALEVFRMYGIADPQPRAYEIDHVIPPDLGGATDVRNLWPQPYDVHPWNAYAKDALENDLVQAVCAGELDLTSAQRELSAGWIAAYQRRFRTQEPLVEHASFRKDEPWE